MINKKTKEIGLSNQHQKTADDFGKQASCNKVQRDDYNFFGINLRTRTISTTIPPPLIHSAVSTTVQPNRPRPTTTPPPLNHSVVSTNVQPNSPRPRGRPPRPKIINPEANSPKPTAPTSLERPQRKRSVNRCNVNLNVQENKTKNRTIINTDSNSEKSLLPEIEENDDCVIVSVTCRKKIHPRKRKQSDIGEAVPEKRICTNHKDSSVKEKNLTEKSLPKKPSPVVNIVNYGFLSGYDYIKPYRQHTDADPSTCYGRTNWPIDWEFSASSLTGHVQKKTSKDILRKIKYICNNGTTNKPLNTVSAPKKNSTLKKYQPSGVRDSSNKLTKLVSTEKSGGSKHNSSASTSNVKRQKGRPPGKKNKISQIMKSSCSRKSPRQHASTLAAIMSTKTSSSDKLVNQSDELMDFDIDNNIIPLDNEGPCILTMAIPNLEHMSPEHQQSDDQRTIKRRQRRRRSITPSPPKLCAQIPTQRTPVNTIDHEVVKLRTKHVDVVKRRARDERLRSAFVYQQLQRIQEIAEESRCELTQNVIPYINEKDFSGYASNTSVLLQTGCSQNQNWSSQMDNDIDSEEPDNMSLQIMYEQTGDKRFLCTDLSNETLQLYHQQRELALAEQLTNNNFNETGFSDLGIDMINASNKRKKKRPNMTGWPKEKRRKVISTNAPSEVSSETLNDDRDVERTNSAKRRRKAADKQKLRRQRLKLEQQRSSKNKLKNKEIRKAIPKQSGRRPGRPRRLDLKKKNTNDTDYRSSSVSSNSTTSSGISRRLIIKKKKLKKQKRMLVENKTATDDESKTIVKRSCGRPRGSGWRQRLKLEMLQRRQNQTSLSSVQQKENVVQEQISTGKLKCVISTRNNRMKLLSNSRSPTTSNQKKNIGNKPKKSTDTYNLSSSCFVPLPVTEVIGKTTRTTVKRKRLVGSWEVGRPKRYHPANHGRNTSCVEEDCCFVGSQPFEQHCPGIGGLSHNTVLENQHDHQKENSNTVSSL